ncbi:MAG: hypothetical protein P8L18_09285 [Verrucomicrobiota bacterium]|nr:hypothetical protein [Verrucomicrobiota bacterium]MDG1891492.1 hypothetical protein [Verrucomicrobiota bacterium]
MNQSKQQGGKYVYGVRKKCPPPGGLPGERINSRHQTQGKNQLPSLMGRFPKDGRVIASGGILAVQHNALTTGTKDTDLGDFFTLPVQQDARLLAGGFMRLCLRSRRWRCYRTRIGIRLLDRG